MIIQLASCVILDAYGRILLVHRSTDELSHWELPGSIIEENESAVEATMRGIDEALGVVVRIVRPLAIEAYEVDEQEYHSAWFLAQITDVDPELRGTKTFDDLDYFEIEDLASLALSADMQLLFEKIMSGEVALDS